MNTFYVNSIQFRDGTITPDRAIALGAASAAGIPRVIPGGDTGASPKLTSGQAQGKITVSWDSGVSGYALESTGSLANPQWTTVAGVANNTAVINAPVGTTFYRLRK